MIYCREKPQEFWSANTFLHKTVCAFYDRAWSAAHKVLKRLFSASLNGHKRQRRLCSGALWTRNFKYFQKLFHQNFCVCTMGYPEKFAHKVLKRFISALLNEHKAIETVQRVPEKFEMLSKGKSVGYMVFLTWKNKIIKLVIWESLGYSIISLDKFRHNWTILHFWTSLDTLRPIWTSLDLLGQYRAISVNLSKNYEKMGWHILD